MKSFNLSILDNINENSNFSIRKKLNEVCQRFHLFLIQNTKKYSKKAMEQRYLTAIFICYFEVHKNTDGLCVNISIVFIEIYSCCMYITVFQFHSTTYYECHHIYLIYHLENYSFEGKLSFDGHPFQLKIYQVFLILTTQLKN